MVTVLVACSPFKGTDTAALDHDASTSEPGDAGGTADGSSPIVAMGCPHPGQGPDMVRIGDVCIDSTEVTCGQFGAMLRSTNVPVLVGTCAGTLPPTTLMLNCPTAVTGDLYPQTCITTCEAELFCTWAGKHLCGARPGAPPVTPPTPLTSEWIHACTGGNNKAEPPPSGCNVMTSATAAIRQVKQCEGPAGVFDLIGNAMERTFIPSTVTRYYTAGDSYFFKSSTAGNTCVNVDDDEASSRAADIGFRCCATPP